MSYLRITILILLLVYSCKQAHGQNKDQPPLKGLTITTENGGIFMEEVKTDINNGIGKLSDPHTKMKRQVDVRELGVPLDENGKIIPLIDHKRQGYMRTESSMDAYRQYYLPQIPNAWTHVPANRIFRGNNYPRPFNPGYGYYPNYAYPGANLQIGPNFSVGLYPNYQRGLLAPLF